MGNKPPITPSLFEQLLEDYGIEVCTEPYRVAKSTPDPNRALTSWEELIDSLVG